MTISRVDGIGRSGRVHSAYISCRDLLRHSRAWSTTAAVRILSIAFVSRVDSLRFAVKGRRTSIATNPSAITNRTVMQLLEATNDLTDLPDNQAGFAFIYDCNGDVGLIPPKLN